MPKKLQKRTHRRNITRRQLIVIGTILLLLYVVVPQLGAFRHSLDLLRDTDVHWVTLAGAAYLGTGLASVCIYKILLRRRLPWWPTIIVEYGSSFANRLVPAGIGAVGVNILYFRRQKYSLEAATAAVSINNLFGFVGHMLLLVMIALFEPRVVGSLKLAAGADKLLILVVSVVVLAIIGVIVMRRFGRQVQGLVHRTVRLIVGYAKRPSTLGGVLLFSLVITLLHSLALMLSAKGAHVPLSIWQAIIVLAVGVGAGAVIPSPGGLGGAEAGLVVGLVAFGLPAASAVTVAILYRLASYWLGFVVGAMAFALAEKRQYL